jgi:ABC-type Zn uptake system ZnuABC Zn-binding protein ZnuA
MLCPPMHSWMSPDDAEYIVEKFAEALAEV